MPSYQEIHKMQIIMLALLSIAGQNRTYMKMSGSWNTSTQVKLWIKLHTIFCLSLGFSNYTFKQINPYNKILSTGKTKNVWLPVYAN